MFRCCICGKEYESEAAAVKCVNKCGREGFETGKFQRKEKIYSDNISATEFDFDIKCPQKEDIEKAIEVLERRGAPKLSVLMLRNQIAERWNYLSNSERAAELGRIQMLGKIYKGKEN